MLQIYIVCEGQTEEKFISDVLAPYLCNKNIYVHPIVLTNARNQSAKNKGGVTSYDQICNCISCLCKSHSKHAYVTTMIDLYGLPKDFPLQDDISVDLYVKVRKLEDTLNKDINNRKFFAYLSVHEFESLLFSKPEAFSLIRSKPEAVDQLCQIKDKFINPEKINNSRDTAPSKRIENLIPNYSKVLNGLVVAKNIGVEQMMNECPHFKLWIDKIQALGANDNVGV